MPCFRSLASQAKFLAVAALLCAAGCRPSRAPEQPSNAAGGDYPIYRFDDHLDSAAVTAGAAASSVAQAERVVWQFDEKKITWELQRGRMGFKPGQLIVKGEGSTPVIASPAKPAIDWSRYEAVVIRMIVEAGGEVKLRLDGKDMVQKLAPPMVWKVYRFDLPAAGSAMSRPLAIMPTDDLYAAVAIDFIELVPRKEKLQGPAGRAFLAKRDEYRGAIYTQAPSSLVWETAVPPRGVVRFGAGVSGKGPVTFKVLAGPSKTEVFSKTVSDAEKWEDGEADLSAFAGRTTRIEFRTEAAAPGAAGLWANPLLASRAPHARPNILLYLVCTLRPDHTSLYGYSRDTTPFLKKLGAAGVVFDDAVAQAPWTKASVPSILTSLQAYTHGLAKESDTIPKGAATLAETLRRAGYVTASIVANPLAGRASGLDRGFDYVMDFPVLQRNRDEASDRGTDSAAVNRALAPWLERHKDEPFFLFILSTDPHAPYRPPAGFEEKFANPAETGAFDRDYEKVRGAWGGGAEVSRAEMKARGVDPDAFIRRAIDRYDGEVAHNDHSIEELFAKLKAAGALDNTLAVIGSDHGEEFWEHGFGAHGHSLYNELIHAALLMWNPKLIPQAHRVSQTVQLIDIMPTVLDLACVAAPEPLEGRSLAPLLRGGSLPGAPAMSTKLALPGAKQGGGAPENRTDSFARVEPEWKLIWRPGAAKAAIKELELYGRKGGDTADVAARHPDAAARMKSEIQAWMERENAVKSKTGAGGSTTLDPATIERLRSLGYLGGKTNP